MARITLVVSLLIALTLLPLFNSYAGNVQVQNVADNKGGVYVVRELKEGDEFFHDRAYTMTNIPGEFLGLTQIQTSADSPSGQDYRLTFEIDCPAYIYTAWDSRDKRPEDQGQDPEDWFTDNYTDTGKILCLDAPHPKVDYWIYKSNEPYPKGKVELLGIDGDIEDSVLMWTIFLEPSIVIDIKPGSDPNSINLESKGVISVAILTTSVADSECIDFDAATVDGTTVQFEGASPVHEGGHLEDVDGDGDIDWVGHFNVQSTGIEAGDTKATLTGETFDGTSIAGTDLIKVVGAKPAPSLNPRRKLTNTWGGIKSEY